jgi:hypothetical protein
MSVGRPDLAAGTFSEAFRSGICDKSKMTGQVTRFCAGLLTLRRSKRRLGKIDSSILDNDYLMRPSKLTPLEIRNIDIALNHRNLADCKSGWTCNHSSLTSSENTEVNILEQQRNA